MKKSTGLLSSVSQETSRLCSWYTDRQQPGLKVNPKKQKWIYHKHKKDPLIIKESLGY